MSSHGVPSVDTYATAILSLLDTARNVKPDKHIEPTLTLSDFGGGIEEIGNLSNDSFTGNNQAHYAAIETACRNIFYDLLVSRCLGTSLNLLISLRIQRQLEIPPLAKYGICLILFPLYQI